MNMKNHCVNSINNLLTLFAIKKSKTIISLSLVLLNAAPEFPSSGTKVANYNIFRIPARIPRAATVSGPPVPTEAALSLATTPSMSSSNANGQTSWPLAPALPDNASKKRGSRFSRGTLVVCNVSLVGQWIDEAKSKLKDPGLVYSYHGGSRIRNAKILAKNAVVVTTYAVLQSDANHHKKNSNDPDYCPPCEQIRWWRIICDESHSVRVSNTKNYKALVKLTAANKWCVTGTPMNTSPTDLKSQLNFIGISYMDKMFSMFSNSMAAVFTTSAGTRRRSWNLNQNAAIGPFLFFMRNAMIRHALTQTVRNSNVCIMTLPPKEETVIEVEFTASERKEYDKVQENAIKLYKEVKSGGNVTRQYLRLTSALLPLRLACSGGQLEEGQVSRKQIPANDLKGNELQLDLEEGTECSICLHPLEDPFATHCAPVPHIFCKECIQGFFCDIQTKPCPCCRAVIKASTMRDVIPVLQDSAMEGNKKIIEDATTPQKTKKKKELKESDIFFRSKFERLKKELTRIRDEGSNQKTLVFSQFTSTLQWMKQELPKHGFQFRTLEGSMPMKKRADALKEFQSDPSITIFLLSMRAGAAGINLTEANYVFMMEPAMNPALEAQAIGRVYRLGQRKPVTVIRMRMKDSFESRLVKVLKRKYSSTKSESEEEKKSEDSAVQSSANQTASSTTDVVAADVGHMKNDKANMMTEEFDALFGITEPEDLPDKREEDEDSEDPPASDTSRSSSPMTHYPFRTTGCSCGHCSDEDSEDRDDREECVIS